jgi:hypothetical protein
MSKVPAYHTTTLFAVFALLASFGHPWITGICVLLALVGPGALAVLLQVAGRLAPQPLLVESAQIRDGDVLAYIATYLVPFAAMQVKTGREQLALGLFVFLLAVVY